MGICLLSTVGLAYYARNKSPAQWPGKVTKYGESGSLQNSILFSRRILRSSKIATMAIRQMQPMAAASSAAKVPAQPVRPNRRAVGDHPKTQLGEAITDQIGEGALDSIGGADRFSAQSRQRRRRSTAADQTPGSPAQTTRPDRRTGCWHVGKPRGWR